PAATTTSTTATAAPARTVKGYLSNATSDTLPSPCRKTSLTSPLPGANHIVRVPLPNGNPAWDSVLCTARAWNVPAGTATLWTPSTFDVPVTPYAWKSRPVWAPCHASPVSG